MRNLKTLLFCGALALCPAMASGQTLTPAQVEKAERPAPVPATTMPADQEAEYAARELAAPELERFKGGASLSITLGTTALVVLAILVALIIIF